MDTVIVVWDRHGVFFQVWTDGYNGDGIAHGKRIAAQIGGTYKVVPPPDAGVTPAEPPESPGRSRG